MIVGYISGLELSNLKNAGWCLISKEPREDGAVCEALFDAPPSRARVLSDRLIAELGVAAAGMARRERMLGQPLSIQAFAEKVIRATVHAMNQSEEAEEAK